ncbi:unnamed protein product [Acanthoscelides obtectus]|uniref:Uncharacterized protein n=1 Tax=Acanthoscelides obtectus TaxID=200917 RepID=A0A9P0QAT7_ACAOB|nr:unnamed protein product [Acanthoscelides obtectus]CAK1643585.1 hypothetical protein AOBTE_LOCUS13591 [Acanthoscelides obtectus]
MPLYNFILEVYQLLFGHHSLKKTLSKSPLVIICQLFLINFLKFIAVFINDTITSFQIPKIEQTGE